MMYISTKESKKPVRSQNGEHTYELIGRVENITEQCSVAYIELEPGKEALQHYHPETEEIFYILSGHGKVILNDQHSEIKTGDCIFVPRGARHQLINTGRNKLVFLAICTPAWIRHTGKV